MIETAFKIIICAERIIRDVFAETSKAGSSLETLVYIIAAIVHKEADLAVFQVTGTQETIASTEDLLPSTRRSLPDICQR